MKYVTPVSVCQAVRVAPLVGARIEIYYLLSEWMKKAVAPLVGARIEIVAYREMHMGDVVAPLVGARIEILNLRLSHYSAASLPSWERGLK